MMAVPLKRRLFTVDEYHRMAENGVLTEDDRVELIDGEIVEMPPIGPGHSGSVDRLGDRFRRWFGDAVIVRGQNPLVLDRHREPEPDIAIVRRRDDYYEDEHPTARDVLLIVEVADSSLEYDRYTKGPLYAAAGVIEYWIVNLVDDELLVLRTPGPNGYRSVRAVGRDKTIRPLAFPDVEIRVSDLLRTRGRAGQEP